MECRSPAFLELDESDGHNGLRHSCQDNLRAFDLPTTGKTLQQTIIPTLEQIVLYGSQAAIKIATSSALWKCGTA